MSKNFTLKLIIALSWVLTSLPPLAAATVAPEGTRRAGGRLTVGGYHSCAVRGNGTVKCWGYNGNGELGDGSTTNRSTPVTVVGLANVVAIASGSGHACALDGGGNVSCWGNNSPGQLGDASGRCGLDERDRHHFRLFSCLCSLGVERSALLGREHQWAIGRRHHHG
jgi:alpha-tubulin suppressor-like RCC1 family protein